MWGYNTLVYFGAFGAFYAIGALLIYYSEKLSLKFSICNFGSKSARMAPLAQLADVRLSIFLQMYKQQREYITDIR